MTKSIKEMKEEYAYANWESDDYHDGAADGLPFDAIGHTAKCFEAGANYVLEEIEKFVKFNRWAAQNLYELIEQLKK